MSYSRLARWDEYRPECLKIALCISLAFVNIVINITSEMPVIQPYEYTVEDEDPFEQIPRTVEAKKVMPKPPKVEVSTEIEIEDPEIIDENEKIIDEPIEDIPPTENVVDEPIKDPVVTKEPAPKVEFIPEKEEPEFVLFAENMPVFGGCMDSSEDEFALRTCTKESLQKFIYSNVKYPSLARETGIEGTVIVEFVVNKKGVVQDWKILRGLSGGCSEAVLKVMSKMPDWKPGKQNGRPVNVMYRMPVQFKLR